MKYRNRKKRKKIGERLDIVVEQEEEPGLYRGWKYPDGFHAPVSREMVLHFSICILNIKY